MRFFVSVVFFLTTFSVFSQDIIPPYYVVIGGFEKEENAQRFVTYAHGENFPAVYAFNEERKIFYVYVRATQAKEVALDIVKNIRANSVFKDAWIFNGVLSGNAMIAKSPPVKETPVREPVEKPVPVIVKEEPLPPPVKEDPETPSAVSGTETPAAPAVQMPPPAGKPFVFKLLNAETGTPLNGMVRLQESERARQFRGYNGNEKVYITPPANRSGKWIVVCQVVGFRQFKKSMSYLEPQRFEGAAVGVQEEIIIPLELERVRRGDYIEMDGVKFFHNAALLTPGSERELGELLAMLEENPDYNIRLHGHANGNESRDIVSLGKSTDFFNPDISNAKNHGSAKELSLLRAELVKAYLVSKGIDESRITAKGEGGKQMVYDPAGTLAGMNDRVEVEITRH